MSTDSSISFKLKEPDVFKGEASKLESFLTQLELNVRLAPQKFPIEELKIMYAVTFLRDNAEGWFRPYLKDYFGNGPDTRGTRT